MEPTKISWAPVLEMYPAGTPRTLGRMREIEERWAEENPIVAGDVGVDEVLLVRYTSAPQLHQLLSEIAKAAEGIVTGLAFYGSKPEATSMEVVKGTVTGFIPGQAFVFLD